MGIPSPSFFLLLDSLFAPVLGPVLAQATNPTRFPRNFGAMLVMISIDMFLVSVLLAGAFLILNLGLLYRRKSDHVGTSAPSDLITLKPTVYPEEPEPVGERSIEEMERHSAEGVLQRVVGRVGSRFQRAVESIKQLEGGTTGTEAHLGGGTEPPREPESRREEEPPLPSKKAS